MKAALLVWSGEEWYRSCSIDIGRLHLYHVNMSETYRRNNNAYYSCHYHVVWCPKYRRDERLNYLMSDVCHQFHAQIERLEVMPDHVHRAGER